MPPASPPSDHQNAIDDHSPLSDEDVGILYEIITCAEQDSNVQTHPFRSIFAAYDSILAQHGLDPDHDQIYLRFLLRLGGEGHIGQTLYDRFESLLADLGIQIEINAEENEIQEVTRSINATVDHSTDLQQQPEAGSDTNIRSRRASFFTLQAHEDGSAGTARVRSSSHTSLAGLQRNSIAQLRNRPFTRATTRPSERSSYRGALSNHSAAQPTRGRLTTQEFSGNLQHYRRRRTSASATRTTTQHDRSNVRRHSRAQSAQAAPVQPEKFPPPDYDSSLVTQEDPQHKDGCGNWEPYMEKHQQTYHIDGRELFYRPTDTQLLRDADTFQHFRVRVVVRNTISRWRSYALETREKNEWMSGIAHTHDHVILLRQSLDQWRAILRFKVETAATERYYVQIGQFAERARDLHLLTKAFTHWQQVARERVEYATETRRQVLRVKYFHAWLTLTVENHQKVRLNGQRKFYTLWRQRSLQKARMDQQASFTQARNLFKTGYWKWFWAFCEKRAPQWKERRLKRDALYHWASLSQERAYQEYEVTVQKYQAIKSNWFSKWLKQTRVALSNSRQATCIYRQKMTARSMAECRRQVRYAPLARQVSNMADWRIAGTTFAAFVNQFRIEQQAYRVNQLRIVRNAWTAWNDRLRWQTLESQIDDRVLVQALYRWVLAERCLLLQRLCEQRQRSLCLGRLLRLYRTRLATQDAICTNIKRKRQARNVKLLLDRWRCSIDLARNNEQHAAEFEALRLSQRIIPSWNSKMNHLRKLDKWAVDADYYFCIVRILRQWRAATVEVKRRRLHEAYAHVRRHNKMKLAWSCIQKWRDRTRHIQDMHVQAQSCDQHRLFQSGTTHFDHWHDRFSFLVDRDDQTTLEFDRRFAHKYLDTWISKTRTHSQLDERARVQAEEYTSNIAFRLIHKLRLRIIELKGQESKAESLRQWYEKRHTQNTLRLWRETTARKRNQLLQAPVFASIRTARRLNMRSLDAAAEGHDDQRAEEWTAFDEAGFDVEQWIPAMRNVEASSTPLPAYLSTPSKRAARARRLSRLSTTPVGTPFATRLRSQLGQTPSRRGEPGRSTQGFGRSAFGAIPESEPRTPGKA
ncbi:MAG: hypothetical protein Q9197_002822 [Variospora fuerteventurae]